VLGVPAILAFCAVAASPAVSGDWVTLSSYGITAIAVDADSVTTVEGSPDTRTAWFRFTYAVMLDCSPPRGCLASSQRIQYRVTCIGGLRGAIAPIQRTLLDLAGNVLAQSELTLNVASYVPPPGTIEGEMVSSFCSDSRLSSFVRSSPPSAWTPTKPVEPAPPLRE
jgi:hypothetical protein